MPNWTYNEVEAYSKDNTFDFRKYMTPVTPPDRIDTSRTRLRFDFEKVVPPPKTKAECPPEYLDPEAHAVQPREDMPWFNWYDWQRDHWGTKWNACDAEMDDPGEPVDFVYFSTAWLEPEGIWQALSEQNPDVVFRVHAEYEEGDVYNSVWARGDKLEELHSDSYEEEEE